jgi:NAD(P)-dependent dehydrogenase (short-subunit alcohol dehydrogenase family)
MNIEGVSAWVTGGGSGLGEATARMLAARGAKVAVLDFNIDAAQEVASSIGGVALKIDVSQSESAVEASSQAVNMIGSARILVNCAGVALAKKILSKNGLISLDEYRRVVEVNLIGTFNMLRLFTAQVTELEPTLTGERGVIINTASVAAFEGQVGQTAYAASKGGVVAMTLPAARELASSGVRVCTIAPGIFETAMLKGLPQAAQDSLGASVPFPSRLGKPAEYASLVCHIIENSMLNGETIRLDGALRMSAR